MSTNNKWGALSMRDRAFLIREAVRNGITDIDSIRDTWEHRFSGDEPTLSGFPEGYIPPEYTYKSPEVYATAMNYYWIPWIQKVENDAKTGYDKNTDTWTPHKSEERGADTIGYGFKLSAHPELVQMLKNNNNRISTSDLNKYAKKVYLDTFATTAKIWNDRYGKDKSFEKLPPELQVLLADKQYNVKNGGLNTYPKFMEAIANERFEDIIREGRVNVRNGQGELVPLGRNKHIENMVRKLQSRLEEEKLNGLPGHYWTDPDFIVRHEYSGETNHTNTVDPLYHYPLDPDDTYTYIDFIPEAQSLALNPETWGRDRIRRKARRMYKGKDSDDIRSYNPNSNSANAALVSHYNFLKQKDEAKRAPKVKHNNDFSFWDAVGTFALSNTAMDHPHPTPQVHDPLTQQEIFRSEDKAAIADMLETQRNFEQEMVKPKLKATKTGLMLVASAGNPYGILGDLGLTVGDSLLTSAIDGNFDNYFTDLGTSAALDVVGHGIGKGVKWLNDIRLQDAKKTKYLADIYNRNRHIQTKIEGRNPVLQDVPARWIDPSDQSRISTMIHGDPAVTGATRIKTGGIGVRGEVPVANFPLMKNGHLNPVHTSIYTTVNSPSGSVVEMYTPETHPIFWSPNVPFFEIPGVKSRASIEKWPGLKAAIKEQSYLEPYRYLTISPNNATIRKMRSRAQHAGEAGIEILTPKVKMEDVIGHEYNPLLGTFELHRYVDPTVSMKTHFPEGLYFDDLYK